MINLKAIKSTHTERIKNRFALKFLTLQAQTKEMRKTRIHNGFKILTDKIESSATLRYPDLPKCVVDSILGACKHFTASLLLSLSMRLLFIQQVLLVQSFTNKSPYFRCAYSF